MYRVMSALVSKSCAGSCSSGVITAMARPRSVRMTSLPARTALMAFEKC